MMLSFSAHPRFPMTEPLYPLLSISRLRMEIDGEGVTTLVAGAGCPLSCQYCINAAILKKPPQTVTAQQLFDRVKCDDLYFQATGGGVTFGGGEALLHTQFIQAFRALCSDRWRIYTETSLHVPTENVRLAAKCVDGFIVDIKDMDPEIYRRYTGKDAALAQENLRLLFSLVGAERIHVRVPLIPSYNTRSAQNESVRRLQEMGFARIETFAYILKPSK